MENDNIQKGNKDIERTQDQIRALSQRLLRAQEEERKRLSQELHNGVVQILIALKLELRLLRSEYQEQEELADKLTRCIDMVEEIRDYVHTQAGSLRPPVLDDLGLLPAVRRMAQGFMKRTGIKTKVEYKGEELELPIAFKTGLYRCIQESLTNIWKHAGAEQAWVDIRAGDSFVEVKIRDDGCGFDPKSLEVSSDHIGLTVMRERIVHLEGRFGIDSEPGRGTEIRIRLPLDHRPLCSG